jgi:hypothetical protein
VENKMDDNTKQKLDGYLELFNEIFAKTRDDKVSMAILVEIAKDIRVEQMKEDKSFNGDLPATDKQKSFLEKLGAVIPQEGLTRKKASEIIENTKKLRASLQKAIKKPIEIQEVSF